LEIPVDPQKCKRWGVSVADVEDVIQTLVGGKGVSRMIEGEKRFDITLRYAEELRASEAAILNAPVDISNNKVAGDDAEAKKSSDSGIAATGAKMPKLALVGGQGVGAFNVLDLSPHRRLRDLVTPLDDQGRQSPDGRFIRAGASTI